MNDLIERYIYDVTRRLPEKDRQEVKNELRANIDDMLPNDFTEEDVVRILKVLGEPRILANEYRSKQRYLISPHWMDDYLFVLKIVLIIFGVISFASTLLDSLLEHDATTVIGGVSEVVANVIVETMQSLFTGFALVTLIFACIEMCGVKGKTNDWDPFKLPSLPKKNAVKISRLGSTIGMMVSIVFGAIFIFLIINNGKFIGWYESQGGLKMTVPLFSDTVIQSFVPFFILMIVASIIVFIVKMSYGHWNRTVAIVHSIYQVLSITLAIVFIRHPRIINPEFFTKAANHFETTVTSIETGISKTTLGFSVFLAIVVSIDLISTWINVFKQKNE